MGGMVTLLKDGKAIASGLRANVTITVDVLHEACDVIEDLETIVGEFQEILAMLSAVTSAKELFVSNSEQARQFVDKTIANGMRYVEERFKSSRQHIQRMKNAIDEVMATEHERPRDEGSDSDWTTIASMRESSVEPMDSSQSSCNECQPDHHGDQDVVSLLSKTVVSSCKTILTLAGRNEADTMVTHLPLIASFFAERFSPSPHSLSSVTKGKDNEKETEDDGDVVDIATAILMEVATVIESSFIAMETLIDASHRR